MTPEEATAYRNGAAGFSETEAGQIGVVGAPITRKPREARRIARAEKEISLRGIAVTRRSIALSTRGKIGMLNERRNTVYTLRFVDGIMDIETRRQERMHESLPNWNRE
jgi:hypothetical protein